MIESNPQPDHAKAFGAFYTDAHVARFLVWWAVRSPTDAVLDPSFGGGVFLKCAAERLRELGGWPEAGVHGVELDPSIHAATAAAMGSRFGVPPGNFVRRDFFEVGAEDVADVNVIVGNPPFIRYQRFAGDARRQALARIALGGVQLSELASSWAPFLVHGVQLLPQGGRLAMVLPMEIFHASYAAAVLRFVGRSFRRVYFLTFKRRLFPDLSQDAVLILAEDKGDHEAQIRHRDLASADQLAEMVETGRTTLAAARRLDAPSLLGGRERLVEQLLPRRARQLYAELKRHPDVRRLGELADVGIGYVTGANEFFHVDAARAKQLGLPPNYLRRAVTRGRALRGLRFTQADWDAALADGDAAFLLHPPDAAKLPDAVARYVAAGERNGVNSGYKCRSRKPWYRVPHVYVPDAFLTYMSGLCPRLVANECAAVAPNTLHVVRLRPLAAVGAAELATVWQSSLTRLSVEVEGHSMGGGMLKLEPTEAQRVVVAAHPLRGDASARTAEVLDKLIRGGGEEAADASVDKLVLVQGLGLSEKDCRTLRAAARALRTRRYTRGEVA